MGADTKDQEGQTALKTLETILFPHLNQCHICKRGLPPLQGVILCDGCMEELRRCQRNGEMCLDFGHEPLDVAVSAYQYADITGRLVRRLKYHGDSSVAQLLSIGMCAAYAKGKERIGDAELIVPVPSHYTAIVRRGYNQAYYLAQVMTEHLGIPMEANALIKSRAVASLVGQTREARRKAVDKAFAVQRRGLIEGKRVLLIDDVLTSGATASSCGKALLLAGATHVSVLTACHA
ncbi:MAG: ComF family protein [Clostridiales bacterium]|nr:ComF family protein [Clostridiales bacterium]